MINVQSIGRNIRKHRERLKITQLELSQKLFVSFQAVSAWERGLALPDLENATKLANFFNVKLDALLQDTESNYFVGIDGGGTKTEMVLFEKEGFIKNRVVVEGSNPNDYGIEKSLNVLKNGLDMLFEGYAAKCIFAGIAGVTTGNNAAIISKALSDKYGVPVYVDTDAVNVLAMAHDPEDAAAAICGTGSCVFLRRNYKLSRIGGWGYIFDQAGSAFDIGKDAISHTLGVFDGLETPTILSDLVEKYVGGDIWTNLSGIYQKGRSYIATFAPLVVEAEALGDKGAAKILERNGERLASLISLAKKKYNAPDEFVVSGGFFKNAVYKNIVESRCGVKLYVPKTQPIYGACLETMRLNGETVDADFRTNFLGGYR